MPALIASPDLVGQPGEISNALASAADVAAFCAQNAAALDHDDAFPEEEFRRIAEAGLFAAPVPQAHGGQGLGTAPGRMWPGLRLLSLLGWGNLSVGRVYEGHVNALQLINLFGTPEQVARYAADAVAGQKLFAVWN